MFKSSVIGRIGKIDARYTPQGKLIVSVSVAVNQKVQGAQVTQWIRGACWEKTGEIVQQYAKVGDRIYIEGDTAVKVYTPANGDPRPDVEITVRAFELLGEKREQQAQPAQAEDEYPF